MLEILNKIKEQYQKLTEELSNPQVFSDQNRYKKLSKEHAHLSQIMELSKEYENILKLMGEAEEVKNSSTDKELLELAKEELAELYPKKEKLEDDLKKMLVPKDPEDDKSSIVEIRAGTGGEEAALFAADLYRMYVKYAEKQGWKVELLSSNPTGVGGFKEVIFSVEGQGAYGNLKYESGVHRVQRVPKTEASGRIHTSASSVAVLPEAEEVDIEIKPEDLRIDVFRSSGPGGQSVNTTDSAVRVTHLPTNTVVTCQDEKSQLKNKTKALKVLRARLLDKALIDQKQKVDQERKSMVGTGDRSAKIRTYNFPQGRVTDHRIGLTLYQLEDVLAGELDEFIQVFKQKEQEQKLSLKEKVNQNEA